MKIFYVGQLWEGGTALERMKTLNSLGHETVAFDISPFARGASRLLQSIAWRFNAGPVVAKMNRAIWREASGLQGVTHIWVDKGVWMYPESIQYLKETTGAQVIHYTPDPQIFLHRSRHFISSLPLYDVVITTKEWEVEAYKEAGAKRVILTHQGYDSRFYPRTVGRAEQERFESDVCFIGHQEKHYARKLKTLSSLDFKLRIWGPGWPRYARIQPWANGLANDGLWGESYPAALASTKIALGLLSKHIPETSTTRTFEIPAMGTFLLAERTPLHQQLFDEGKEAEFFSSDEELLDKTRFYLNHDEARETIAAAGRARCEKSRYATNNLLSRIVESLSDDM